MTLDNDEKEIRDYKVSQLKFKPRRKREKNPVNNEQLKALEELDKKEGKTSIE